MPLPCPEASSLEVPYHSTATCTTTAIAAASDSAAAGLRSPGGLLSDAAATEETAAPDAAEADTAADPQRSTGDTVPTAAVAATAVATTIADTLPAANNHHHYCCYHGLEDCFGGRLQVLVTCSCTHFGTPAKAWGLGVSRFITTRASVWGLQLGPAGPVWRYLRIWRSLKSYC
ncbi:Hypothetical predicted protein [Marmota monax]|uniref:Uncharacterized protein n=1 Tax=Marmota monax TaxID=9995 RepID=A0A5E4ASF8_MARMO|nr:Hypothetical predicted protein [Marmota monax]